MEFFMSPDTPELAPRKETPVRKFNLGRFITDGVVFLAELIIPVIVAVVALYYLAGAVNFWSLAPGLVEIFFGVAVVAISLGLGVAVDAFIGMRTPKAKGAARLRQYQLRLVRLALGGLLIPLAVVLIANFVPISGKNTGMVLFIQFAKRPAQTTPTSLISATVLHASNPAIRIQGIQALQAIHTLDSLDGLLQILKEDPNALKDGGEYAALVQAVASYGVDAKAKLFDLFQQAEPAASQASAGPAGDLYDRYLALAIEALKAEIKNQPQSDQKLAQVNDAAASFKSAIDALQASGSGGSGASLQDFVLAAFQAMDIKGDADLINFARTTAANPAFSDRVRGQALLLLSAQGGKDELETFYTYLQNTSETLQGYALQAIAAAEAKSTK